MIILKESGIIMIHQIIPGTRLKKRENTDDKSYIGLDFLSSVFSVTSGLVLSQIKELSGVDAPALQNWIKRGWVPNPVNRKYNIDQVARILIINMLRPALMLEQIAYILEYVNADVKSNSQAGYFPESRLYDLICKVIDLCTADDNFKTRSLDIYISRAMREYNYLSDDKRLRIKNSLKAVITAYEATVLIDKSVDLIENFEENM